MRQEACNAGYLGWKVGDIKFRYDKKTSQVDCEEKMLWISNVRHSKVLNFVCIDAGGFYQQQVQ